MLTLKLNQTKITFPRNLTKISERINDLNEHRNFEEEPIEILNYDENTFDIFKKWFKMLNDVLDYDVNDENTQIFYPQFFEKLDTDVLIKLFNFGNSNDINLLCDTVAYCFRNITPIDNLICGKIANMPMIFKISDEFVHLITKWKYAKYINDNNYRNLYVSEWRSFKFRYHNLRGSMSLNDAQGSREIPGYVFLKLYRIWKTKGMRFFVSNDFKLLCNVMNINAGIEEIDQTTGKSRMINCEVDEFFASTEDKVLNTFKAFMNPFRDLYRIANETQTEQVNNFIVDVVIV